MAHDNNNNDDNKLDINIDIQQPPRKKRKRLKTEYSEFADIITKLGNDYDPLLFSCFVYVQGEGLTCTQYMILRQLLWKIRTVFPDDFDIRFKYIFLKIEKKRNAFPMLYLLLKKVMCLFSGIVDVERQNGIKKWICTAKRD